MAVRLPSDAEIILACNNASSKFGLGRALISNTIFVRFGLGISAEEAATQQYVWDHIDHESFTVPQPYYFQDTPQEGGFTFGYFLMEYVEGTILSTYLKDVTIEERDTTVDALTTALAHLATLPVPVDQDPGPVGCAPPEATFGGMEGVH